MRIIRRESLKVWQDSLIFGVGFVEIGCDVPDGIRYLPINVAAPLMETPQ
jgi:hypothetical protein